MASGILLLLDDIASLLDDAASVSKLAVHKTAGVLGDDLAVNAEKATGFAASRELPVLWAITKGALLNKLMILPLAFLLSAFAPWAIGPILVLGGTYLAFEGAEKVLEWMGISAHGTTPTSEAGKTGKSEAAKIKSAVRTDFILSIEIVVIALGTVLGQSFGIQLLVVTGVALLATFAVYGVVALIVRMDDMGTALLHHAASMPRKGFMGRVAGLVSASGAALILGLPWVIRILGVVGTLAMLLVGGGLLAHHIGLLHHWIDPLGLFPALLAELLLGMAVGCAVLGMIRLWERCRARCF